MFNTPVNYVDNKHYRKYISSCRKLMMGNDFIVRSVLIRQLRKVTLLDIRDLYIWAKNSNVPSVIIRQFGKIALLVIRNLCIWANISNVQILNISLL